MCQSCTIALYCKNGLIFLYHLVSKCFSRLEWIDMIALITSHVHIWASRLDAKAYCSVLMYPICDRICCLFVWDPSLSPLNLYVGNVVTSGHRLLKECTNISALKTKRKKKHQSPPPAPVFCKSPRCSPSGVQLSLLSFPQWEPGLCHHAAHCGVDKGSLAVGAQNIWFQ